MIDPLSVGGGILGLVSGLFSKKMDYDQKKWEMALKVHQEDVKHARSVTNKHISFTRRTLAFMLIGTLCVGILGAAFFDIDMWVMYTESNGSILGWILGDTTTVLKKLPDGLVFPPEFKAACYFVLTFYFGSGKMRK